MTSPLFKDALLTEKQARAWLGIIQRTLDSYIEQGKLQPRYQVNKDGAQVFFDQAEIEQLVRERAQPKPRKVMKFRQPISRFLEKIRVDDRGCWRWIGCKSHIGYGQFRVDARRRTRSELSSPHRFAYEYFVGPIPEGCEIDHLCHVRDCANPLHLRAVTHQENQASLRKAKCKHGHLMTLENSGYTPQLHRYCKACRHAAALKWQAEHPEAMRLHQQRRKERKQAQKRAEREYVDGALDRVLAMFES
jgi:HNH endonuclease